MTVIPGGASPRPAYLDNSPDEDRRALNKNTRRQHTTQSSATHVDRERQIVPESDLWYSQYEQTHGPHGSLEESLRYFMRVFEEAPAAYVITDSHLVVTNVNATAQRMFGRDFARLKGKPLSLLVAESDREAFRRILTRAVLDSQDSISRPLKLRIDGGKADADIPFTARVLRDQEGNPQCVCWIFHDRHRTSDEDIL